MAPALAVVQSQRRPGMLKGLSKRIPRIVPERLLQEDPRQVHMGQGVVRLDGDCLLEQRPRPLLVLRRMPMEVLQSAQQQFVGGHGFRQLPFGLARAGHLSLP